MPEAAPLTRGLVNAELTEKIIGAAMEVHRALGPGLLESAYEDCFCYELDVRGLSYTRQVLLPLEYKGMMLDRAYRPDLLVEGSVIVELKTLDKILPLHEAQLLTYLKLSGVTTRLLLNFNEKLLRSGIRRLVLTPARE